MAFDPAKVKLSSSIKHSGVFNCVALEPDCCKLLCGSDDFGVHVIDLTAAKKEPIARWSKHDSYVSAVVCLKQAGKPVVISGSYDRTLVWWDFATGQPKQTVEAHAGWIRDVIATPDGSRLISVGDDMLVKIWDAATGKAIRTLEGHAKQTPQGHVTALYAVAVSPDGKLVASGDRHGEVRVWELDTGRVASTFQVPTLYTYDPKQRKRSIGGIRSLAFSADGKQLAAGGVGQIGNVDGLGGPTHVEIWNWAKPEVQLTFGVKGQQGLVNHLLFHAGDFLIGAGGGGNGFLAFWKVNPIPPAAVGKKAEVPGNTLKIDGHAHRFCVHPAKPELYVAGYRKLDVYSVAS